MASRFKRADVALGLAVVVLAAVGAGSHAAIRGLLSNVGQVDTTHRTIASIGRVHTALLDVQSAVRGFLISSDDTFLDPYRTAGPAISALQALAILFMVIFLLFLASPPGSKLDADLECLLEKSNGSASTSSFRAVLTPGTP